jgi:hypothetical protein
LIDRHYSPPPEVKTEAILSNDGKQYSPVKVAENHIVSSDVINIQLIIK